MEVNKTIVNVNMLLFTRNLEGISYITSLIQCLMSILKLIIIYFALLVEILSEMIISTFHIKNFSLTSALAAILALPNFMLGNKYAYTCM